MSNAQSRRDKLGIDGRSRVADEQGTSYFVVDDDRRRKVAGPFDSDEYAQRVLERCNWPWPDELRVVTADATTWMEVR